MVADTKMIEYHGSHSVESYILTIMNMVCQTVGQGVAAGEQVSASKNKRDLFCSFHAIPK